MQRYSVSQFAKLLDINPQTLRNWDREDKLKPAYIGENGYRYYSQDQLESMVGKKKDSRIVVGYCRVSSKKQAQDLEDQMENVRTYLLSQEVQFEIITDIGSGIDYSKKGLDKLLYLVLARKVSKVVVLYKDRLATFGVDLIESICTKVNTEIVVIDHTEKSEQVDVVEDLVQIIPVFNCKLQGRNAKKAKELIKELKQNS